MILKLQKQNTFAKSDLIFNFNLQIINSSKKSNFRIGQIKKYAGNNVLNFQI